MSRAAQVLGLGLIVGSIGGLYWLWSSVSQLWPEMRDSRASVLSADRAHIVRYDEHGKKLWELAASALSIGEDMSIAEEITLHFFDSEGQEALTVPRSSGEAAQSHWGYRAARGDCCQWARLLAEHGESLVEQREEDLDDIISGAHRERGVHPDGTGL
jgi:hypothetical protein